MVLTTAESAWGFDVLQTLAVPDLVEVLTVFSALPMVKNESNGICTLTHLEYDNGDKLVAMDLVNQTFETLI